MGIEPTYRAWEARVLPLNYTRFLCGAALAYVRWMGNAIPKCHGLEARKP